jgi:hypothetical protein
MKIVKVTYTTKSEYSDRNQNNIKLVMSDLQKTDNKGINYSSCMSADGKTFTHTAFFKSDEDEKILQTLPAFKVFQEELKASGLEAPPKQEILTLVGTSVDIFKI